jgi:hypothetical protein
MGVFGIVFAKTGSINSGKGLRFEAWEIPPVWDSRPFFKDQNTAGLGFKIFFKV